MTYKHFEAYMEACHNFRNTESYWDDGVRDFMLAIFGRISSGFDFDNPKTKKHINLFTNGYDTASAEYERIGGLSKKKIDILIDRANNGDFYGYIDKAEL